eukprot:472492-Hanusia_phi.AAC.9
MLTSTTPLSEADFNSIYAYLLDASSLKFPDTSLQLLLLAAVEAMLDKYDVQNPRGLIHERLVNKAIQSARYLVFEDKLDENSEGVASMLFQATTVRAVCYVHNMMT